MMLLSLISAISGVSLLAGTVAGNVVPENQDSAFPPGTIPPLSNCYLSTPTTCSCDNGVTTAVFTKHTSSSVITLCASFPFPVVSNVPRPPVSLRRRAPAEESDESAKKREKDPKAFDPFTVFNKILRPFNTHRRRAVEGSDESKKREKDSKVVDPDATVTEVQRRSNLRLPRPPPSLQRRALTKGSDEWKKKVEKGATQLAAIAAATDDANCINLNEYSVDKARLVAPVSYLKRTILPSIGVTIVKADWMEFRAYYPKLDLENDDEIGKAKNWFINKYSPVNGALSADDNSRTKLEDGKPHNWNKVVWALWSAACRTAGKDPTSLKYVIRHNIRNDATKEVLEVAGAGLGLDKIRTFNPDTEEFKALLQTPNGNGVGHILRENPSMKKKFKSVSIAKTSGPDPDDPEPEWQMWFEFEAK